MKNIKLFKEFALYVDKDGKMRESDWETDENEDIGPGDLVHFKKYGTLYVVTLTSDGYVVSEDEEQRYMGDEGEGHIIPLSAALDAQILEKGDDEGYLMESKSNEILVKFVSKRNQTQAFNVYKNPDGRITKIEKPNHVHVRFPFLVGQVLNRSVETWACNNNFYIDGKDTCPEEKIFGIRKSDIPQGHELRNLFPNKFRK